MATEITMNESSVPAYTLKQLVQYFLKLGYSGFGGPVALVGYMYLGATLAGLAFVLPSFLMVVAIGIAGRRWHRPTIRV